MAGGGGSCTGSCENTAKIYTKPQQDYVNAWKALSLIVAAFGYIKALQLQSKMVDLAKQAQDRADKYYGIAESAHYKIAVPTWNRMRDLYDRYKTFHGKENEFIKCAYSRKEYCPDYKLQEGRALGRAQVMFDKAALQAKRAMGKYNTGRACHNATYFAVVTALAKVDAVNIAYRYEDQKKIQMDELYWQRWRQGAAYIEHMGDRGVSAITGGAGVIRGSLQTLNQAVETYMDANADLASAYASAASTWANVAGGAMKMAGAGSTGWGGGMGGAGGGGNSMGLSYGGANSPMGGGYGGGSYMGDGYSGGSGMDGGLTVHGGYGQNSYGSG